MRCCLPVREFDLVIDTNHLQLCASNPADKGPYRDRLSDHLFGVLTGHDVVGDVHDGPQRPLPKRQDSSLEERHGAPEETSKQTTQPVPTLQSETI
ncbi:hypothetical protein LSAT2_001121 [Lamellibrachia satsuma]|nr:hypothetical protein LSAT2_001121 [Lamellibrachia satsuma]